MKYLRKFNESSVEDPKPTIEYLKDIFLEVEDDGFNVDIGRPGEFTYYLGRSLTHMKTDMSGNIIIVNIYKSDIPLAWSPNKSHRFKMEDVLETILSSESYMKSLGYKIGLIEIREIKDGSSGENIVYDSSVLKSPLGLRKEHSIETFTLKIEFTKE
jgi:hypothetical protein